MSKNLGNIPSQVGMTEEQEQTFTNGINKGRKLERSMLLEYTYPDGLGTGGTFTDGDQFSQETVQTIIDNVVATTKADTEQRIIKLLRTELGQYFIWVDDTPYIKGINLDGFITHIEAEGENK